MVEPTAVYLHIGAPKTGTTYLQQVLDANREAMRPAGVLYPRGVAQHAAVWDIRGGVEGRHGHQSYAGRWEGILRDVAEWHGRAVVVSSEMFVLLDETQTETVLTSFGDAEVHVVYTARDLVRQVPAVWQERVKNTRVLPYKTFRRDVLGKRETPMAQHFWKAQDAASALRRWSVGVPPERVHVVTAPPPGAPPHVLWERFATVLGLDPAEYPSEVPVTNESLSVTAVEVLRRYNQRHGREMPILQYREDVKRPMMAPLTQAVGDRRRLPLSYAARNRLVDVSEEMVAKLAAAGYDVVGSLEDLVPPRPARSERGAKEPGPDDLTDAEVLDALLDVVHHLLQNRRAEPGTRPEVSDEEAPPS